MVLYGFAFLVMALVLFSLSSVLFSSNYSLNIKISSLDNDWFKLLDHNHNYIDDRLEKIIDNNSSRYVRIILGFSTKINNELLEIIKSIGARIVCGPWRIVNALTVEIPADKIYYLRNLLLYTDTNHDGYSDLLYIELDNKLSLEMHYAGYAMGYRPYVWGMGYTGKYVTIAVPDTGVDIHAQDLRKAYSEGRISGVSVTDEEWYIDRIGHGTAIAYVLVGSYNGTNGTLPLSSGLKGPIPPGKTYIFPTPQYQVWNTGILKINILLYPYRNTSTYTTYLLKIPRYGNVLTAISRGDYSVVETNNTWKYMGDDVAESILKYSINSSSDEATYIVAIHNGDENNNIYAWYQAWVPSIIGSYNTKYNVSMGLLPNGRIRVYKIIDSNGNIYESYLVSALDRIYEESKIYNISVVSISVAGKGYSETLRNATLKLVENGMLIISAAGNDGVSENDQGPATNTYPGAFPWVISVAAIDGFYNVTSYSSMGGLSTYDNTTVKPDVAAIGGGYYFSIYASDSNNEPDFYHDVNGNIEQYDPSSIDLESFMGTSIAAPMVAAEAALIIEVFRETRTSQNISLWDQLVDQDPLVAVHIVRDIIEATATETYPMTREYNGTDLTSYSPTLDKGFKDPHEGYGVINPIGAIVLARYLAEYLTNNSYPYNYGEDKTPVISIKWGFRDGVAYNPPNPPYLYRFPNGSSSYGLIVGFRNYVFQIGDKSLNTRYCVRIIADTNDPRHTDFDAYIYALNTTSWDVDLVNRTSYGMGVIDEETYFTPQDNNTTYYIVVKRAREDSIGGYIKLFIGPTITAQFINGRYIWVNATAASPPRIARYALIILHHINSTGDYIDKLVIVNTRNRNNLSNINMSLNIGYGLRSDWEWYLTIIFTHENTSLNNITEKHIVEGPITIRISIGRETRLLLKAPNNVLDHEKYSLIARLLNDAGKPISNRTIYFYESINKSLWYMIGSCKTNISGYAVLVLNKSIGGTYYYRAVYPGDNETQYTVSNIAPVNVFVRTKLLLLVSNTKPYTIQPVNITVRLVTLYDNKPLPGENITIWLSLDNGSSWKPLIHGLTDNRGYYNYTQAFTTKGNYLLKANFTGDNKTYTLPSTSQIIPIKSIITPTSTSIEYNGGCLRVFDKIVFVTRLNYTYDNVSKPIIHAPVFLELYNDSSWIIINNTYTDREGLAILTYMFRRNGTYIFRIHYPGNETFSEYLSRNISVVVRNLYTKIKLVSIPISGVIGENISIIVRLLDERNKPVSNAILYLEKHVNGSWTRITSAKTTLLGYAIISWRENIPGNYTYRVVFNGSPYIYESSISNPFNIVVSKYSTNLLLETNESELFVGKVIVFKTILRYAGNKPLNNTIIYLQCLIGNKWVNLLFNKTNSFGEAYFNVKTRSAGNYTFRAYYPGNLTYQPTYSNIVNIVVEPLPVKIVINTNRSVYVGNVLTIRVKLLLLNNTPLIDQPVNIWVSRDNNTWFLISTLYTNEYGETTLKYTFTKPSIYYVKANYSDPGRRIGMWRYSSAESKTIMINVSKIPTKIIISTNTTHTYVGEGIQIIIKLFRINDSKPLINKPVIIEAFINNTWIVKAIIYTSNNGYATYVLTSNVAGTIAYRAIFNGSEIYLGSISRSIIIHYLKKPVRIIIVGVKPDKPIVGKELIIIAKIIALGKPLPNQILRLIINNGIQVVNASTSYGYVFFKTIINKPGKYSFTIQYSGSKMYDDALNNTVITIKYSSRIILTTEYILNKNEVVLIVRARLYIGNRTSCGKHVFLYEYVNGKWVLVGSNTTNPSGVTVFVLKMTKLMNKYVFRAVFNGSNDAWPATNTSTIYINLNTNTSTRTGKTNILFGEILRDELSLLILVIAIIGIILFITSFKTRKR
jgi:hypothetical protein